MREVLDYLDERRSEFDRHLCVARLLEGRVDQAVADDTLQVEVRHVNTVKSGLLIHLYNIVEATMVQTMQAVGRAVVTERPKHWKSEVMKEWIRSQIWDGTERIGEGAFGKLVGISAALAAGEAPGAFVVKGEAGSWDDDAIKKVAERLGCPLVLDAATRRAAYEPVYRNDMTAMRYLASRRNAIAHGATTFEDGARDQTLADISQLADRVLPYLKAVAKSFDAYLNAKAFLAAVPEAA